MDISDSFPSDLINFRRKIETRKLIPHQLTVAVIYVWGSGVCPRHELRCPIKYKQTNFLYTFIVYVLMVKFYGTKFLNFLYVFFFNKKTTASSFTEYLNNQNGQKAPFSIVSSKPKASESSHGIKARSTYTDNQSASLLAMLVLTIGVDSLLILNCIELFSPHSQN